MNGVDGPVKGLLYGDRGQLVASCIGIAVNIVWVAVVSLVGLTIVGKLVGNRVSEQTETDGLDEPEMGMPGYVADPGRAAPPEIGHSAATPPMMAATASNQEPA